MSLGLIAFYVSVNLAALGFFFWVTRRHLKREALRPPIELRAGEILLNDVYADYIPPRMSVQYGAGRLYLTNERLIWRRLPVPPVFDPKFVPLVSEVEIDATAIDAVGVKDAFPFAQQPKADLLIHTEEVIHQIALVQPYLWLWGISERAHRWRDAILEVSRKARAERPGNNV